MTASSYAVACAVERLASEDKSADESEDESEKRIGRDDAIRICRQKDKRAGRPFV